MQYPDLVRALSTHYKPAPIVIAERFRFQKRNQKDSETVSDYVVALEFSGHSEPHHVNALSSASFSEKGRKGQFRRQNDNKAQSKGQKGVKTTLGHNRHATDVREDTQHVTADL